MFCGSMGLNNDLKEIMKKNNLHEGANNNPGDFVLEKAFVN
jgi:ferredoxin--NADP+ reductase